MTSFAPIFPASLKPGDKIGVIAPSSYHAAEVFAPAIQYLTAKGFEVVMHPQTALAYGQMSGTPAEKVAALHDYFADPSIKAILGTAGGNGCIHLLDLVDYDLIKANPKIFVGFSDITILMNAITAKTGLMTFHGPTLTRISKTDATWPKQMLSVLTGATDHIKLKEAKIITKGNMDGPLYGGNLSALQTLIGTPYAPDMDGAILLIEDINDHLSRYDRMIGHMKQAGWFKNLSGVIIGEFINSLDNPKRPFGFTIEDIVQNHIPDVPILGNAPIGHGERLCTLPIGAKVSLKNNQISFKSLA